ncbi:sarcosine oxidase subunit gamma [Paraburkholderia fungorum]|jgi:sarcosine oxidase subunit gamma|uniref:Sarcosine oxidase, gamma subunit n=1 Tax=Paraburkholderia fungorum TaxID=134537 RepID=A0AAU8T9D8_9BURK|nr:sarcosine oxidase subunit gamma [Paraburkholderia fungorum]AJZ63091.1 sarcosine oxidase, gamma subunit [Paraburkholderia fungorum]MBB5546442.1 sarcosine oxidase subunit gamma [Paraburkholderia fungorum]PNE52207.1 sarcosine oxidase subunit gamma [Paraburkholderia fungorum]PZR47530.1 MAG: sarcosine oxidase subunit gamma [Paraburkholderia fungorum]QLD51104.1 sarcosine oxidase subunit gamma [Paraburkholderia fungorum]
MWNETRGTVAAVNRAVGEQTGVWQESPLVGVDALLKKHQATASAAFRLNERPFLELVNVRGDTRDAAFVSAVESVLGCRPPEKANTLARGNGYDMLWLGPDEWLVRSATAHDATRPAPLLAKLGAAFAGVFASAVDIGSGYTVLEISGTRSREVLARGCPLDLHPKLFGVGQCAQSHYFKASMTLLPTGADSFDIVVRRSFADYFVKMMLDAAEPLMS